MESRATRRFNIIAAHFSVNDDIFSTPTHLLPMNCSSSLNSVIRRYDNRTSYARQASDSQAFFMRQPSIDQKFNASLNPIIRRYDNRTYYARQASDSQACFMRQASTEQHHVTAPSKRISSLNDASCNAYDSPVFSRVSTMESNTTSMEAIRSVVTNSPSCDSPQFARPSRELLAPDYPKFATPEREVEQQKQSCPSKMISASENHEFKWSPRMDVAECSGKYVVTVELPGITASNVRVLVDEQKLTVMGNRSTQWWRMEAAPVNSISAYNKNEIIQGAYNVVWPLPSNVNRETVSAEFVDGILQISIPKL